MHFASLILEDLRTPGGRTYQPHGRGCNTCKAGSNYCTDSTYCTGKSHTDNRSYSCKDLRPDSRTLPRDNHIRYCTPHNSRGNKVAAPGNNTPGTGNNTLAPWLERRSPPS